MSAAGVFLKFFSVITGIKIMLFPAYRSTDFEVHRNWLAITHSIPLDRWYKDATSEWTLDYPPFFAYFEWLLSQLAKYVDPQMLIVQNLNYASERTIVFQRLSVVITDTLFAWGVWRCLNALKIPKATQQRRATELVLLWNVGLIFVDHIHFQYNGFLFGILLLSISLLLEERFLLGAFVFASLLNFKHIFLYIAPVLGAYILKHYCFDVKKGAALKNITKVIIVGILPFVLSFGPFYKQLPQVLSRLFPFKRGLTHSYWAPNFWAIYNIFDKIAEVGLKIPRSGESNTAGLVQEYKHVFLPTITPMITFVLTILFMLPCVIKIFYVIEKRECKHMLLRSIVICACTSFMFGWHVHEKAILMSLIPLGLLSMTDAKEAKFTFLLSIVGLYSLFPLLFHIDLLVIRYSLHLFYVFGMYGQIIRVFNLPPELYFYECIYLLGFIVLPIYEHIISPLSGLDEKLPFMPLLLTSLYCSIGVIYFFITYYIHLLSIDIVSAKSKSSTKHKSKLKKKSKVK